MKITADGFEAEVAELSASENFFQFLQERFKHVGGSTARFFLWSVGYRLTPTSEEKEWMEKSTN